MNPTDMPLAERQSNSLFARAIEKKRLSQGTELTQCTDERRVENALADYFVFVQQHQGAKTDCLSFWSTCPEKWNCIKELALDMLTIPASSASIERAFSYAGHATEKRKNRTGPDLLKWKLFNHLNKEFMNTL